MIKYSRIQKVQLFVFFKENSLTKKRGTTTQFDLLRWVWIFDVFDPESNMLKVNYRCKSFVAMSCGKSMNWILNPATTHRMPSMLRSHAAHCTHEIHTNAVLILLQSSNVIAKTPLNCYSNVLAYFRLILIVIFVNGWIESHSLTHHNECLSFKLWKVVHCWVINRYTHTRIKYWFELIGVEAIKATDRIRRWMARVCVLWLCDKWSIVEA